MKQSLCSCRVETNCVWKQFCNTSFSLFKTNEEPTHIKQKKGEQIIPLSRKFKRYLGKELITEKEN